MSPANRSKPTFGPEALSEQYAIEQDAADPLRRLRSEFIIPTSADIKRTKLPEHEDKTNGYASEPCTYLCGNSLGLQPRRTAEYIRKYLDTWATKGVYGHFQELHGAVSSPWAKIDDDVKEQMGKIVGAHPSEVAVMQSLTANLHFLMASFYKPTKDRYKIIIEGKAFPSDHYAVQSQLAHHDLLPSALVCIEPPNPEQAYLPTSHILSIIDAHASTTALLLLPGIQFYSGQFLDIPTITTHAQSKGITVGWDLAHAVGNVPLQLHSWNVDFAAWCNYKYMNAGPGAIGGLFVHDKHGTVDKASDGSLSYRPRLSGWWGHDRASRFRMENSFVPIPGAAGFQLSNPSVIDTTAVLASLSVFAQTSIEDLREKSMRVTAYLEWLLTREGYERFYRIITPENPEERGAQLSIRLKPGLLDGVMEILEQQSVVVDERKPDVVRVAPAPLYNGYRDAWRFVRVFREACQMVAEGKGPGGKSLIEEGGKDVGAWAEIK